jgi:arginyl-tRNA synthetase
MKPCFKDLDIEVLDTRIWPTDYTWSRFRTHVAEKIAGVVGRPADDIWMWLERPKNDEHGHFALPIPRLKVEGNPAAFASDLAAKLGSDEVITGASSMGPFLNVKVDTGKILVSTLGEVLKMRSAYGQNVIGEGKHVMVEYSSPNIAKPFHAGHLRSTIIGNFIKLAYRANGFEAKGVNYLGDWGKQYGLLAIGFKKYGSEEALVADPIRHLFDVYVKISADAEADPSVDEAARSYFKAMEEGEPEAMGLWSRFRTLSIEKYKEVYRRLNVEFDIYSGESLYEERMKRSVAELKEKNLLVESKGAHVIDLEAFKLGKPLVLKSDGATLYLTRDIAAAEHRFEEFKLDKSIYVVSSQQDLHLAQLFKTMEVMGKPFAKHMLHINYGLVKGMKTRKGQVVFLDDILDEAKETMHAVMKLNADKYAQVGDPEGTSDVLAVSAVVVQDMAARRIKDYAFNIDRVTQFEGDTGPYLQYAHARLCSVERRSELVVDGSEDLGLLSEKDAHDLAVLIARYPEVVQEARITAEPCCVVNYLLLLCRAVSTTLDKLWVKGQEETVAKARLALYVSARITIGNGLALIGLKPLERM